jgi:predicted PurR-regulated permease PerM
LLVLSALLVVGLCDYVLRPRLVGRETMPAVLTFAALFGGVQVLGLIGLLVGPLIMAVGVALLRLYAKDSRPGPWPIAKSGAA